ncbi:DUF3427 domain-containing protein [Paenactinomyces guangxiensis]|uniref:DUF3427 domain-containing protein n=1 Tax=Paenactinomyces guangxiensis TaxID=1490290 RepID=A0A7W2AAN4_9BACL|nr:DUF3427 domain-containing protein [Paenactinomyces guangxiensis]MBA4496442.1 DUF3427 domain-containing protein [Paenactinomyces guangxiensis]MBH8593558.1 DUF3427 domain-containing protein [Paenactinomyces guangxiensis]
MVQLILYNEYSRKDVHDIFDPFSKFSPSNGTWGLHGIVRIPNRQKDYVFFVTFGQKQGNHIFDENVTDQGILTWQSQPGQGLDHPWIQDFINHDHLNHNIYLFLRTSKIDKKTKKAKPYTYLGRLAYIAHDPNLEKPVYFKWQILDWNLPGDIARKMELEIIETTTKTEYQYKCQLEKTEAPMPQLVKERNTNNFSARIFDFAEDNQKKKELGVKGEQLVLVYEKQLLIDAGRSNLAKKVRHVSMVEGDGAGYDILSFTPEGEIKYIEVKTTVGGANTPFYMTINELNFSKTYSDQYYLYRVYNMNSHGGKANFYVIKGDISLQRELLPTVFKVI